jgi:hypothetical protein
MGVLTSEVGYTSATTGRGDHEVHKGHVALGREKKSRYRILVGVYSEEYVLTRLITGLADSDPAENIDVLPLCLVYVVQVEASAKC